MKDKAAPVNVTIEKNYDSEMCGSIPLHLVNLVQPHGMLLVLDKKELRILQVSENSESQVGILPDELLGQPLSEYLTEEKYTELLDKLNRQSTEDKIPYNLVFKTKEKAKAFTAVFLPQEEYILVELEESTTSEDESFIRLYQQIKYITSLLKQTQNIPDLSQRAAEELKSFSGFDKVMVYQFDGAWNGMVIGQAREEDMDDYMGLRFPASDVPKQARELYFRNPYRLIPSRKYTPVRLVPVINPLTHRFTDLSECSLRSVANVHLEYMANMNIMASMSLPLIIEGKLWGLISCHHKTARYLSYEMRSALELLSGIVSAQLEAKQKEENMNLRIQLRSLHVKLMEQLYTSSTFAEGLLESKVTLLDLLSLSGAVVAYDGGIWKAGSTPDTQQVKELISWLRRTKTAGVYATDSLPRDYPYGKDYRSIVSGLIAIPINAEQGEFILGFKPEVLQTIEWGGNPNNAIQMEPDGKTYHPRNSFATYRETVKETASPWLDEEIAAAETLRNAILEKIIKER